MELHIAKDPAQLSENVAAWISNYILEVLQQQERFTLVLSGGSTPKALFALLAKEPYSQMIPWERIHFFWGDERAVPFEDERNNARMAYEVLLDKVPVNPDNIHVMRTDIDPAKSAEEYAAILHKYFGKENTTFDLVLLGMATTGIPCPSSPALKWCTKRKPGRMPSSCRHRICTALPSPHRW